MNTLFIILFALLSVNAVTKKGENISASAYIKDNTVHSEPDDSRLHCSRNRLFYSFHSSEAV
jgi:hypothetical protein